MEFYFVFMNEPRVYTESEVGALVGTVLRLVGLDRALCSWDVGRDQFVKGQMVKRENLYYGSTANEQEYQERLRRGDANRTQLVENLRQAISEYLALPDSLQEEFRDRYGIDLEIIAVPFI